MGVVVPSMSSRIASGAGNVRGPETDRLKTLVDAGLRVVRRPSGRILEQADGADAPIAAEVEPVVRTPWHADEIAGFDLDGEDGFTRRVDVKQPAALDDETDLVFVVPVLGVELCQHRVEAGGRRMHVDDVGGHVPALRFQFVDLAFVRLENLGGR